MLATVCHLQRPGTLREHTLQLQRFSIFQASTSFSLFKTDATDHLRHWHAAWRSCQVSQIYMTWILKTAVIPPSRLCIIPGFWTCNKFPVESRADAWRTEEKPLCSPDRWLTQLTAIVPQSFHSYFVMTKMPWISVAFWSLQLVRYTCPHLWWTYIRHVSGLTTKCYIVY